MQAESQKALHPKSLSTNYRPDISGLRAVAVMLVLADHFRTHFSGGYVGVDVFFVISGYLISATILKEMANCTFSVGKFYERRIRRIFPALMVMLLVVSAVAYCVLFPAELVDFTGSLLASLFSVSNFWFWHQAGYFDAPSAFKPLLHTWSLAVEEQFYIFFPLFLILIRRLAPKQLRSAIIGLASLTFVLACIYVKRDASAAFFFSPLRAWELLVGTILSQRYLPTLTHVMSRNVATAVGMLLIIVPALRYTATTSFPGLAALPPCLGAALIIAGGETGSSVVGHLLGLRPVAFIGLISYSIYLWHWPVLVFQNVGLVIASLPGDDRRLKLVMFAISIILGYLSWRFVETPFRTGRLRPGSNVLFFITGIGTALLTAISLWFLLTDGLPNRFPADALQAARYLRYNRREPYREGVCFLSTDDAFTAFSPAACLSEDPSKKNVLIIGDSQAAQLWFGMMTEFPEVHFLQATALNWRDNMPAATSKLSHYVHQVFLVQHHVDAVILADRWKVDDLTFITQELAQMKQRNIPVILIGPMTEYDEPFPRVLATSLRDHKPELIVQHLSSEPRSLDTTLSEWARDKWHVPYISYFDNLCSPGCQSYGAPGVPLLFDEHHLTAEGSVFFAKTVRDRKQLSPALSNMVRNKSLRKPQ